MSNVWECICGKPWKDGRHTNAMKRDVGNNLWKGSPALLVPYRQWTREKLPNGNQGFVCCGDDGFLRSFDPHDQRDIGEIVAVEWKSFGKDIDGPTQKAFAAIELGRIRGTLSIALHGGNVPGPLSHYPIPREIADSDWLPEQPVVADKITINDHWTHVDDDVSEQELINAMLSAVGFSQYAA